jgi:tRNA(Ile)-lysidine synthase
MKTVARGRSSPASQKRAVGAPLGPAIERRVQRFIRKRDLLHSGDSVLVGVSGGPDSTALLLLLARLATKLRLKLTAAYFDHRLRGMKEAQRECAFVAGLAEGLGLPLITGSADVRGHARESRISLEEAAREQRYAFLAEAAGRSGAGVVAVGHTADDQVETVLMHILRGSGLFGLAGMLPRSPWPLKIEGAADLSLVRPLLEATREETHAYCRQAGREPLQDATNRSLAYRRNRLRHEILPILRRYNPRLDQALLRLAAAAAVDREALEYVAADVLAVAGRVDGGEARLSRGRLRSLPEGLRRHVLRAASGRLLGDLQDIGASHLEAMSAALEKPSGSELDLPRGLHLQVGYDEIVLSLPGQEPPVDVLPDGETPLTVPGRTQVGPWLFEARILPAEEAPPASRREGEAYLDIDALQGELTVRRRRLGDRFRPLGLGGEKKLQDLFVDAKVPRRRRDAVPLVCDRGGIVWVVGHRIAERARVGASPRRTLHLRIQRHQ